MPVIYSCQSTHCVLPPCTSFPNFTMSSLKVLIHITVFSTTNVRNVMPTWLRYWWIAQEPNYYAHEIEFPFSPFLASWIGGLKWRCKESFKVQASECRKGLSFQSHYYLTSNVQLPWQQTSAGKSCTSWVIALCWGASVLVEINQVGVKLSVIAPLSFWMLGLIHQTSMNEQHADKLFNRLPGGCEKWVSKIICKLKRKINYWAWRRLCWPSIRSKTITYTNAV